MNNICVIEQSLLHDGTPPRDGWLIEDRCCRQGRGGSGLQCRYAARGRLQLIALRRAGSEEAAPDRTSPLRYTRTCSARASRSATCTTCAPVNELLRSLAPVGAFRPALQVATEIPGADGKLRPSNSRRRSSG